MSTISPPIGSMADALARRSIDLRRLLVVLAIYAAIVAGYLAAAHWAANRQPFPAGPPPFPGQTIGGSVEATIYTGGQTPQLGAVAKALLGGWVAEIQEMKSDRLLRRALALLAGSLLLALLLWRLREPWHRAPALILLCALSILLSLRLGIGMDEFYINLKHAFNLRYFGTFSANATEPIEATVDFLPFLAAAGLSAVLPVSLASAAIAIGLAGNVILIFTAYDIAHRMTGSSAVAWVAAAMISVLPPVVFVGATGFMATLFGGLLLLAFDWVVVRRGRWTFRGYLLLGLLPLVRLEGILPGCLMLAGAGLQLVVAGLRPWSPWRHLYRSGRVLALRGCVLLGPLLLLSLWRYLVFGAVTPVPVTYKNTGLDIEYLRAGVRQLLELLRFHRTDLFQLFFAPVLIWFLLRLGLRAVVFVLAMIALCLAYYTGGGDWFDQAWGRYPLPLMCLLLVLTLCAIYRAGAAITRWPLPVFALGVAVICGIATQWHGKNAYRYGWEEFNKSWDRWARINSLSAFGTFLKHTTPERARIGSAEMATIMYFAERDLVDLLGIANPDVARAPLDPAFGAGDILHKKRAPQTLLRRKADVVALYEMVFWLPPNVDRTSTAAIAKFAEEQSHRDIMMMVAFYRVGDLRALERAGFRQHLVIEGNYLYVYWVGTDMAADHARMLAARGFRAIGNGTLAYRVGDEFAPRFSADPAAAGAR
jgi:hypothetical protein